MYNLRPGPLFSPIPGYFLPSSPSLRSRPLFFPHHPDKKNTIFLFSFRIDRKQKRNLHEIKKIIIIIFRGCKKSFHFSVTFFRYFSATRPFPTIPKRKKAFVWKERKLFEHIATNSNRYTIRGNSIYSILPKNKNGKIER